MLMVCVVSFLMAMISGGLSLHTIVSKRLRCSLNYYGLVLISLAFGLFFAVGIITVFAGKMASFDGAYCFLLFILSPIPTLAGFLIPKRHFDLEDTDQTGDFVDKIQSKVKF